MSGTIGKCWASRRAWLPDAGVIVGLAAVGALKFWSWITPWLGSRQYLARDFGLAVEPHFYHHLKRGTVLLWDPTLGTGSPFLGGGTHHPMFVQAQLHLFYPLNLVWLGLAEAGQAIPHVVLQYHHAFHYLLAGSFTYLYGRLLGLARSPSAVAAIAFMLSGFLLGHSRHWTIIDTIAWLPLILAAVVRAEVTERPRWGVVAGLALGAALLAGHPQIFYYVALAAGALGLTLVARRVVGGRPCRRLAGILLLVPLVALGLAAVQLVPSWEVALGSQRVGLDYGWKATGSLSPAFLVQLLLPWGLAGVAAWRALADEFFLYVGIVPLVFAGYAVARRWDWRTAFHASLGLGALLLAFGEHFGLHRLAFELLPGFHLFRIPARILGLVDFALAVLAGLGVQALLAQPEAPGLLRFLRRAVVVAGVSVVGLYGLVLWAEGTARETAFRQAANQGVLLLIWLGLTLLAVSWRARGHVPASATSLLIVTLLLDLLGGHFPLGDEIASPDLRRPAEQRWVEVFQAESAPFRLSRGDQIHPQTIYRHGWAVVDGESTFAPPAFLELYALRQANPRVLDLLNVKYFVGGADVDTALEPKTPRLAVWPEAIRRVRLPSPVTARRLELHSHLVYGERFGQGDVVAWLGVLGDDGVAARVPMRAGIETAEWALDRPGARVAHARPPVSRSWTVPEGFQGHTYRATFALPAGVRVRDLLVRRTAGDGVLVVERVLLDGEELAPPHDRFRLVRPGLHENRYVLPRAFLVRHARVVSSDQLLTQLRDSDPEEEVLLTAPLPPGWTPAEPAGGPLPAVAIARYGPHRIRLETETAGPLWLVLGDTHDARWQAWDNGQPATVYRANHALRALPLRPGRHVIELRYRQPSFWAGLGVSLATVAALAVAGFARLGRRRTI